MKNKFSARNLVIVFALMMALFAAGAAFAAQMRPARPGAPAVKMHDWQQCLRDCARSCGGNWNSPCMQACSYGCVQ
jgi:hypothetical protein